MSKNCFFIGGPFENNVFHMGTRFPVNVIGEGVIHACKLMHLKQSVATTKSLFRPLATGSRKRSKGVEVGKEKTTIHLLVFSPHGSKLFLLLPLHFHTRTSGSDLMPVANQCKPNRISFHP
jgi:hypothetical protein